jgi:hypothetical protein
MLKWTLAAIAGGGAAGLVQGTTVVARGISTATTGGLGNPFFATIELGGALFTSILALLVPLLAVGLIAVFLFVIGRKAVQKTRKVQPIQPGIS